MVSRIAAGMVTRTEEGTMTGIAEAMTGIDMMTAGAMTIVVIKAMTNLGPMPESW
ncbi:MAG: hypothetical protein WA610_13010 [Thermodesulfovibrionales bacterium]